MSASWRTAMHLNRMDAVGTRLWLRLKLVDEWFVALAWANREPLWHETYSINDDADGFGGVWGEG